MKDSIISSKLNKPEISNAVIERTKLLDILNTYESKDLILISAYAGTGKSTLICSWLESIDLPYVWYSLDSWDSDFQLFLTYIVEGIKSIDQSVADELSDLCQGISTLGYDGFSRAFVSIIQSLKRRFVLVLDDFHSIDNPQIEEFIKFLIDYSSSKVLVTIITREDPTFPLSKLRLKRRIIEFRDKELRLSFSDSKKFLRVYTNVTLSEDDLNLLSEKTEGWAAGLQLSAISLEGHHDTHGFIKDFSGSNNYIVDYLLEEVLDNQDKELSRFMLYTSLLDYFNFELCDQMLAFSKGTSKFFIDQMLKKNLFLIPVDHNRTWFRFHHLLKDILYQRLISSISSDDLNIYHVRAADYYKDLNQYQNAVSHYLKGHDTLSAAALIELMWTDMDVELKARPWLNMARQLPEETLKTHPVLSLGYGWSLIDTGEITGYEQWLSHAKSLYDRYISGDTENIIIVDKTQFDLLPSSVASAMGYMSAAMGDIDNLVYYAKEALSTLSEGHNYKRGVTAMLLAIAHWTKYEFDDAISIIKQSTIDIESDVNLLVKYSFKMVAAEINIHRGHLNEAMRIIDRCMIETEGANITKPLLATFYLLKAKVSYLRCHDDEAISLLEKSYEYGSIMSLIDWKYKYHRLCAQVFTAKSEFKSAIDHMEKCREFYTANPLPDEISMDMIEQMIYLKQGTLSDFSKLDTLESHILGDTLQYIFLKLSTDYDISMEAFLMSTAQDILRLACDNKILSLQVRSKVLLGLILKNSGKNVDGDIFITEALHLATPEKYYRPFFEYMNHSDALSLLSPNATSELDESFHSLNNTLSEPLTPRELDVLNLIAIGRSNKEICEELYLALSTVKGYTQNIYGKLQVNRRTEAIAKAREIGIIK